MILQFKKKKSIEKKVEEDIYKRLYPKRELQFLLFDPFIEEYMSPEEYDWSESIPIYHMNWYREDELQGKLF